MQLNVFDTEHPCPGLAIRANQVNSYHGWQGRNTDGGSLGADIKGTLPLPFVANAEEREATRI